MTPHQLIVLFVQVWNDYKNYKIKVNSIFVLHHVKAACAVSDHWSLGLGYTVLEFISNTVKTIQYQSAANLARWKLKRETRDVRVPWCCANNFSSASSRKMIAHKLLLIQEVSYLFVVSSSAFWTRRIFGSPRTRQESKAASFLPLLT